MYDQAPAVALALSSIGWAVVACLTARAVAHDALPAAGVEAEGTARGRTIGPLLGECTAVGPGGRCEGDGQGDEGEHFHRGVQMQAGAVRVSVSTRATTHYYE